MPFEIRAHTIYDRYKWTEDYVKNLPLVSVNRHYELLSDLIEREQKMKVDEHTAWRTFLKGGFENIIKALSRRP